MDAKLLELGLTADQIQGLKDLGVEKEADLQFLELSDLTELGLKPIAARKILAVLKPQAQPAAPAATPSMPSTITLVTGSPDNMTLEELLKAVTTGGKRGDQRYIQVITRLTYGKNVFVRMPGSDSLDIAAICEYVADMDPDDNPEFIGDEPTESLSEVLEKRAQANPITGEKLDTKSRWLKVSEEWRIIAAYGIASGRLNADEITLLTELSSEKPNPIRWDQIKTAYARAKARNEPTAMAAANSLIYRKRPSYRPSGTQRDGGRGFSSASGTRGDAEAAIGDAVAYLSGNTQATNSELRKLIEDGFNISELETLCANTGAKADEELSLDHIGAARDQRSLAALKLVRWAAQRGLLVPLVCAVFDLRQNILRSIIEKLATSQQAANRPAGPTVTINTGGGHVYGSIDTKGGDFIGGRGQE